MIYVFLLLTSLMVLAQYKLEGKIVNLISILIVLYIFIVAINNFFVSDILGFFEVSDEVLGMLLLGLVSFFMGALPVSLAINKDLIIESDNLRRFSNYQITIIAIIVASIGFIGVIKLLYVYFSGGFNLDNIDLNEGVMTSGLVGHLLLVTHALIPILFLYWTYYPKKIFYLLPILLILFITFFHL